VIRWGSGAGEHAALDVEIPEADYSKLATRDGCVEYLTAAVVR
jgi:hypothetical protein